MKELVRFLLCFMCVKLIISKPQEETHFHFDLDPVNDLQNGYQLKDPAKRTLGYHRHYALGKHVKIHPSGYKYVLGYSPINVKYVPVIKPITVLRPVLQNSIKPSWKPIMTPSKFYLPQPVLHIPKPVHHIDNEWKPIVPVKPAAVPIVEQAVSLPIEQQQPVVPAVPGPVPAPVVPTVPIKPELHNYLFFQTPIAKPIFLPHLGLLHVARPQLPVLPLGASFPAPVLPNGAGALGLPHPVHHPVPGPHPAVLTQIPAIPPEPVQPIPVPPPLHVDHPVAAPPISTPQLVQHYPFAVHPHPFPHLHPQPAPPIAHLHPQAHPHPFLPVTHLHPQPAPPIAHLHPQPGPLITHLHPQPGLPIPHLHPQPGPPIAHLHPQPGLPIPHLHPQPGSLITHLHPQPAPTITHLHPLSNATPISVEFHGNPHFVPIQKIPVQTPIISRQPLPHENQPFNPDAAIHPGETDLDVPEHLPEHPNFRHYLQPQNPLFHNGNIVRPSGALEPPFIHEHDQ